MRWLVRLALTLAIFGIAAFLACSLLPERLAVDAPILNSMFGWGAEPPAGDAFRARIRAADGFSVGLYAVVPKARFLRPTPAGDLLVSVPREGRIVRLVRDANADGLSGWKNEMMGKGEVFDPRRIWPPPSARSLRFSKDFARVTGELPVGLKMYGGQYYSIVPETPGLARRGSREPRPPSYGNPNSTIT